MTKEEFVSMLNSELENLEQEYKFARQTVEYFKTINSGGKELQEAEYRLKVVQKKFDALRGFVDLPAYARIQAMSDIEIEEYKKEKIEELELKINEIEAREKQEKVKFSQLKAEQEQLIAKIGNLFGNERDNAIYRGQQLAVKLSEYDINNQWGVFANIRKEIDKVRMQQEQIKAMSSQEIKQQLSSKINKSNDLAQRIEWTKDPIEASEKLKSSVALDPEKAQRMANLLTDYRKLSDEQSQIEVYMDLGYGLPRELEKKLIQYKSYYDSRKNKAHNPDKLMELVQEYEGSFEQAKANFNKQFTEQKLLKLIGTEYSMESSEVDMEYLQQHTDKLGDGELEHLQNLVEQRNKLSNKIFKTKDTKFEINNLNDRIKSEQLKIYKEIKGWYESQSKELLGIRSGILYYSLDAFRYSLEECKKDIRSSEQAIAQVKENIQKAQVVMNQQIQNLETKKSEIAQQIRALGGEKYKETDIPYALYSKETNLESIVDAQNRFYKRDVVDRVQQEAQKQADIREAELRGITIEQLLQMKQQPQIIDDEFMIENTEKEVSHGIMK